MKARTRSAAKQRHICLVYCDQLPTLKSIISSPKKAVAFAKKLINKRIVLNIYYHYFEEERKFIYKHGMVDGSLPLGGKSIFYACFKVDADIFFMSCPSGICNVQVILYPVY